jgi:hypothetical protein
VSVGTSNTTDCYATFFGKRFIGIVRDDSGNTIMVFEDGRGFVRARDMPGFWVVSAAEVQRCVAKRKRELAATVASLDATLALAAGLPEITA